MASKLAAARIARHGGIPLVIANGTTPGVLPEILAGKPVGTLIAPPKRTMRFHKLWIAFAARRPAGSVVVDAGAAEALRRHGRSLLASGVTAVHGRFHAGEAVAIVDEAHQEIGRGLSNFSSGDLTRVRGLRSDTIAEVLGAKTAAEVVHRDHLVLTEALR